MRGRITAGLLTCLLLLTGCATTVSISARFPARYADTADIRRIAVGGFNGFGGPEFQSALQAELFAATFDGQPYFTVVAAGGPLDPTGAGAYGRSVGAQGVIYGSVSTDFNTSNYQGSEDRCVEWKDKKCKKYRSFPIPCWRRTADLMVTPSLVNVATGRIVYSAQKRASRSASWCANQTPSGSDLELVSGAQREILDDIRRDIAPFNTTLDATLKTRGDGLSAELKSQFAAAVKAASAGNMGQACDGWTAVNKASPRNLDTVYDLGVCAESGGDYAGALVLYRQAQGLATAPDKDIAASIARADQLAAARAALAKTKAGKRSPI
ncbi:hypothetical protein [Phenylobacterium aquaticum]|uniref:hypothetical protein n=1 Tax=Phenylobacterium aquaticum TaxID=1763816 RepID=UPI0026F11420|nr:hypothetical protein [Phenylobacterium aquaticum]